MTRKIIFIIIGALLFLLLLLLLWFWLLNRTPADEGGGAQSGFATTTDKTAGQDGGNTDDSNSGQDYLDTQAGGEFIVTEDFAASPAGGTGAGAGTGVGVGTQYQRPYKIVATGGSNKKLSKGSYVVSKDNVKIGTYIIDPTELGDGSGLPTYTISPLGGLGTIAALPTGTYTFAVDTSTPTPPIDETQSPIVETNQPPPERVAVTTGINSGAWIGSNLALREFTPTQIEQINSTAGLSGTPLISTTPQSASLTTSGLIIGASAAGCLAQYLVNEVSGSLQAATKDRGEALVGGPYVVVWDYNASAKANAGKFKTIEECLVKTIARAAIDQITRSVVQWINSGFNGQPSFVTDFNQYFANVADQAAGEFIKGSSLSFLCSPFSSQIKIAIAQSYARRNNNAATCSLTKVVNNVNGFLRGNWGAGGWRGLLQLTTMPTNNPYGAFAYAQTGLQSAVAAAQNNANRNVTAGGFISLQKEVCDTVPQRDSTGEIVGTAKANCKRVVTTPGSIIEESLKKTAVNAPIDGLNLAQNVNDIIMALTNQVMLKALYGGLGSSLNGVTNPLAPAIDQNASAAAQAMLVELQSRLTLAGQYASVQQGSVADIHNAQSGLNTAFNCWGVASSTATTPANEQYASAKAVEADTAQQLLEARIGTYNTEITRANNTLATIQNLQSQVLYATTPADIQAAAQAGQAANAQGAFLTQADVTTAQQNRTTLQADLAARNQQTNSSITECRAFTP